MIRRAIFHLLIVFLSLAVLWSIPTNIAHAEEENVSPYGAAYTQEEAQAYYLAIEDCSTPSLECLVRNVSRFTAIEWTNDIAGSNGDCVTNPQKEGCSGSTGSDSGQGRKLANSTLGGLATIISGMYSHPPASSVTYIADVLHSAKIIPPAYAQGLGFAAMDPILPLWKTFRNVAYMFFVIIFVIMGFLIMFRSKVGQTAITAQQAIPKIIISLLMVTFSYAIGGFLIDLMYLSMVLIMGIFDTVLSGHNYLSMDIFELGGELWGNLNNNLDFGDIIKALFDNLIDEKTGSGKTLLSVIGGLTLKIIVAVAMLIGLVKLFFELLRAYATIVLSIVTSPITLMMNAIPGNNAFMTWIKTLVGHLLPFPTVLVVVAMFGVFTEGASRSDGGFMPPFLIGSGQSDVITAVLGLAILLALPEIVKHIREAIAPKNAFAEMILSSAKQNFQAGWTGKTPYGQIPLGLSGRNITKLGAGLGAGAITTPAGALIGGGISKLRGGSFERGAKIGALGGAVAPVLATKAPGLVREGFNIIKREGSDIATTETIGTVLRKVAERPGRTGAWAKDLLASKYQRANRGDGDRNPQTIDSAQAPDQNPQSGEGF